MIICDTREQKPLWDPERFIVKVQKLDEGDYTTDELLNKAHLERKSGIDLYSSIIHGHKRFVRELERAREKGITLAVFVECPKEDFVGKRFPYGWNLKCKPGALRKIVITMQDKYGVEFVWCKDREDFREKALLWFENQLRLQNKVVNVGFG